MKINPQLLKQTMKRMGIRQENIDATQVIIKTPSKNLIINNPNVQKIYMGGEESLQITGDIEEETITGDDIKTVSEQAGVSEEEARLALKKTNGDLAEAILYFKKRKD